MKVIEQDSTPSSCRGVDQINYGIAKFGSMSCGLVMLVNRVNSEREIEK